MNRVIYTGIILMFMMGVVSFTKAQSANGFEKKEMTVGENKLLYRILYPEHFDKSKKYPLVLVLHGSGERGSDNEKQLVHGSEKFLDPKNSQEYPAIVVFPQCQKGDFWSNVKIESSVLLGNSFEFQRKGKPTTAMRNALHLLDSLVSLDHVDNSRIYVGGISMGGMGVFEIVNRRPDVFAAAFPICGGGNPEAVKEYAQKVNFWVFHGAKDDVVLPKYSAQMVSALEKAGGKVEYTLYPNANHNSWDSAFAEPELFPWLFSQSK